MVAGLAVRFVISDLPQTNAKAWDEISHLG